MITPTRELAKQISDVFVHFLPPELTHGLLIGGQDLAADVDQLNTKGWVCIGDMRVGLYWGYEGGCVLGMRMGVYWGYEGGCVLGI